MLPIPADVLRSYEAALQRKGIDGSRAPHFVRWLRFYLDFCSKYRFASGLVSSVPRFIAKLREKHQEEWKCRQAEEAVGVYLAMVVRDRSEPPPTIIPKQDARRDPRFLERVPQGRQREPRAEVGRSDRVRSNVQSQGYVCVKCWLFATL